MTRIAARGVQKIIDFQVETGEPMVFVQPGSLKIARRPEHEAQLNDEVNQGTNLGLDVALISLDEARCLMPYLVTEGIRAVMHMRTDLYLEPVQVPLGYARASARLGATLLANTPAQEILTEGGASPACARRAARYVPASWSTRGAPGSALWRRRSDRR